MFAFVYSTFFIFLQIQFAKHDSISYRYFNAGVCGSDPIYQYHLLETKLQKYQPDLVIVNIGNDMDDLVYRGGFERFEKNGWVNNRNIELFYATSFIFRLIIHRVMGYNDLIMSNKSYLLKKQNAMNTMMEVITKFDKLSKQKDFQLLIVFYPDKGEVVSKKFIYWDKTIQYTTNNNIHTLNLLDYYIHQEQINIDNVNYYYWQSDGHHNAKGYEVYGKAVYEKLDELNIVKKK